MKKFFLLTTITLPLGIFAQGANTNINPPTHAQEEQQAQNINYYNKIDENNNSLGNASNGINNDINLIQTNIGNYQQQANPPAQQQSSLGNIFGLNDNDNTQGKVKCKDCEEVKQAIKASHAPSSGSYHKKSKDWKKIFSGRMHMKMKKIFARKHKVKTSYSVCFNW